MSIRKITADYIFPISSPCISNGVVIVDEDGEIIDLGFREEFGEDDLEYLPGIICPGFVNTHCHLELSHLKGHLESGKGLVEFIKPIASIRKQFNEDQVLQAISDAEEEMLKNGIVAVGDISNDSVSFPQKAKGNLFYHTFIEFYGFKIDEAATLERALALAKSLGEGASYSFVPHAPYSVSTALYDVINQLNAKRKSPLCVHNQESKAEMELFEYGTGAFVDFYQGLGLEDFKNYFPLTEMSSLEWVLNNLKGKQNMILVHNTQTELAHIKLSKKLHKKLYWCLCPNANLYIENQLPNMELFMSKGIKPTIGTDSLGSNHQLSILEEIKTLQSHYPQLSTANLLEWASWNGAKALGIEKDYGSIDIGKKPGLVLIEDLDVEVQFTKLSRAIRLI